MKSIIPNNQDWIRIIVSRIESKKIAVDATMGNGYDTTWLAQLFGHVYSFDIQQKALDVTSESLKLQKISNVDLILASHEYIDSYVTNADCIIFNLGYLPNSDKIIKTTPNSTIKAIEKSLKIINKNGLIIITIYQAHDLKLEANSVLAFLDTIDSKKFIVHRFENINRILPPYVITIEKIRL